MSLKQSLSFELGLLTASVQRRELDGAVASTDFC